MLRFRRRHKKFRRPRTLTDPDNNDESGRRHSHRLAEPADSADAIARTRSKSHADDYPNHINEIAWISQLENTVNLNENTVLYADVVKAFVLAPHEINKSCFINCLMGNDTQTVLSQSVTIREMHLCDEDMHDLTIQIWNLPESGPCDHYSLQELLYSSHSLYLLVWDLASSNEATYVKDVSYLDLEQAEQALRDDIVRRVIPWLDCLPESCAYILPIGVVDSSRINGVEEQRRCSILEEVLQEHMKKSHVDGISMKKSVLCVQSHADRHGFQEIQNAIKRACHISTVFGHIRKPVPLGVLQVLCLIHSYKTAGKQFVSLRELFDKVADLSNQSLDADCILKALKFLMFTGQVLYYNLALEPSAEFVVLDPQWLFLSLTCVLRDSFMSMKIGGVDPWAGSNEQSAVEVFGKGCPLLRKQDARALRQQRLGIRPKSKEAEVLLDFFQALSDCSGMFLPLKAGSEEVSLVTPMLQTEASYGVWTYTTRESWNSTLCHMWQFPINSRAPARLMERLIVGVLQGLYDFVNNGSPPESFREDLQAEIRYIRCWKSALKVEIACKYKNRQTQNFRISIIQLFVAVANKHSKHSVGAECIDAGSDSVIVSGKGLSAHNARALWQGGYRVVLNATREVLSEFSDLRFQVLCPDCLARKSRHSAAAESWDRLISIGESISPVTSCLFGHPIDCHFVCGTNFSELEHDETGLFPHPPASVKVSELLHSVVNVGLWDPRTREIVASGSGFIVDTLKGLIVASAHVFYNYEAKDMDGFEQPYRGIFAAKAIVAVVPENSEDDTAVYRYFAEIVAEDIHTVDACILRITHRLEVDAISRRMLKSRWQAFPLPNCRNEKLPFLELTEDYELGDPVRIVGYNQGGEGRQTTCPHVYLSAGFEKGEVRCNFVAPDEVYEEALFHPRKEIIVICSTAHGHSGSPFVNNEGQCIGILCRSDVENPRRNYLVPSSEIVPLVRKATKQKQE